MKVTTTYSIDILKEANRPMKKIAKIALICAPIALALWVLNLVFEIAYGIPMLDDVQSELVSFLGLLCLFLGIFISYRIRKSYKAYNGDGKVNEYEFTEEHMTVRCTCGEEIIADVKCPYDEIVKLKESENYFFLFVNDITLYPVDKAGMLPEEQATLRAYVNAGIKRRKERMKAKKL